MLGIPTGPINWPIGAGDTFRGVYDREAEEVLLFHRVEGGARLVPVTTAGPTFSLSNTPTTSGSRADFRQPYATGALVFP